MSGGELVGVMLVLIATQYLFSLLLWDRLTEILEALKDKEPKA
jgi:hypothetical protein